MLEILVQKKQQLEAVLNEFSLYVEYLTFFIRFMLSSHINNVGL